MSTISLPYTFSPNTLGASSQVNGNFSTIVTDYNGNITNANLAAAANISPSKLTNLSSINGYRLSSSNSSALPGDTSSVSTIYLYPYTGTQISLPDASGNFNVYDLGATIPSYALTGLTNATVYSLYAYNSGTISSPTVTLTAIAWTNSTTPDSQTLSHGVLLSSSNNLYRYVGAFYTTGTTTTSDTGAGGQRYIANVNNLTLRAISCNSDSASGIVSSSFASTSNTNGTGRVTYLQAFGGLSVTFASTMCVANATSGNFTWHMIGLDSTSTASYASVFIPYSNGVQGSTEISQSFVQSVGLHYIQRGIAVGGGTGSINNTGLSAAIMENLSAFVYI